MKLLLIFDIFGYILVFFGFISVIVINIDLIVVIFGYILVILINFGLNVVTFGYIFVNFGEIVANTRQF